jgi:hypothetical protein|tara:strand:- start:481 stop:699 length:219 start_codon:yes stop_codon:yes gene_type:complete
MVYVFVRSNNGKKILVLDSTIESLRLRQRNRYMNNDKVEPMKFASYKETLKNIKKYDTKVIGPYEFNTLCRL